MTLQPKRIVLTSYGYLNGERTRAAITVDSVQEASLFSEFLDEVAGIPTCVTIEEPNNDDERSQFLYGNKKFYDYVKRFADEEESK